jgi:small GTP-binding protein
MASDFKYDVFLSYSSKHKAVVREVAERLRADGLRVWLDDWEICPGDSISEKIEEGLERSRVLVLCMSGNVFDCDRALLEGTYRFRDPLNKERRFICLRLDKAPTNWSQPQFPYINWITENREQEYAKLLEGCRPTGKPPKAEAPALVAKKTVRLNDTDIYAYAFSPDGKRALSGSVAKLQLWDVETGRCLRILDAISTRGCGVAWSERHALSCSKDKPVRVWAIEEGSFVQTMGHGTSVALSLDGGRAVYGDGDTVVVEELNTRGTYWSSYFKLTGHSGNVLSVALSADGRRALSGSEDNIVRVWDVPEGHTGRPRYELSTLRPTYVLEGHTGRVLSVALSADGRRALSGSKDTTVRVWDVDTGHCLHVFHGHTDGVLSVALSPDGCRALSGSEDTTVRVWEVEIGRCVGVFEGHAEAVSVAWNADGRHALSGDKGGCVQVWDLVEILTVVRAPEAAAAALPPAEEQVQYTNAKVLLVGESGSGKTGLSKRLALNDWQPSDSTVGAWVTQWKIPALGNEVEREIWLWDFGGQADQRLIHQLYMDETALAVLVFDGQKEDLFETLGHWDRDLTRASRQAFSKLLVAGRVDAGGLRVSRSQIEAFAKERSYTQFLETSAKFNRGCEELKRAIVDGIRWEEISWRSSPLLFKRLKEEIVRLKDAGRVLMRFNELRETLQLRLSGEFARFTDEELRAVVSLLAGPGVVWELKFGSWVLLQPERINAYAQAVIQTIRSDRHERGCIAEERVLKGDLVYHASVARLAGDEERFVLLAMHQTLVERGLCLREKTDKGPLLIFPSYYRRERPELVGHPAVLVSYRFNGFLDDIYATLVVRLHHIGPFHQDQLWRYAADFKTITGRQLGVKLTRRAEGVGELDVYFDPTIPMEEKIIFSKYVHEHLLQSARDVIRLRYYVCPHCGTPVANREVAMKKLEEGKKDILCVNCDDPANRVPLWDELEELFASADMKQRVRELRERSAFVLDNESKDRALVGEVISTVALAAQIGREFNVSDHGIDMEIEFKDDNHEATGAKLYLQLKSGDSYLRSRKSDGAEIFTIKDERHVRYWMAQRFPVLLVIRNSEGEVRWMEIRDWLKHATDNGKKDVKQIVFKGERFDVMSVRRWRDKASGMQ